jgi:hypothetical protein
MNFTDTITPQNVIFTAGTVVVMAWILEKLKTFYLDFREAVGKVFDEKLNNGISVKFKAIIQEAIKEHEVRFDARLENITQDHEARIRRLEASVKDGSGSR